MNKYSRQPFEGHTHRFKVRFIVSTDWREDTSMDIYSNCGDKAELVQFIEEKKSSKVLSYAIEGIATKEQDEMSAKFIDEVLNTI